jgi:membrane-bound lytic murein transglycosylase A
MNRRCCITGLLIAVVLSGSCATGRRPISTTEALVVVKTKNWPTMMDDLDAGGFVDACEQSLDYFASVPPERIYRIGAFERQASELVAGVRRAADIVGEESSPELRVRALQEEFILLQSIGRDGRGEVLVTGYYEPELEARRELEMPYEYPVYRVPEDLISVDLDVFGVVSQDRTKLLGRVEDQELLPYPDRESIDFEDGLPGSTEVLGYLSDPVELFFLQVQGSGTLLFPDGGRLRAGYASGNGHPYRSIGRLLLEEGAMTVDEMSMQSIKSYLAEHPEELRRVLSHNPSYVFFRPLSTEGGPLGCYGVQVTEGRSIATDRRLFPAPIVAFVDGTLPAPGTESRRFSRFVVNQDTGGAIRGPGRVDLFFGAGPLAGELAGRTKHRGRLFFLLPKYPIP